MNNISGKVILKESGVGIPDLLVVVYDVDPNTKPEELLGNNGLIVGGNTSTLARIGQGFPGDRLGSVLTDQNGAFELAYEDNEFRIRNEGEKRPDLFIIVMAPEELGTDTDSRILFISSTIRQNAGRIEQILIRLASDQLEKVALQVPSSRGTEQDAPEQIISQLINGEKLRTTLTLGINDIHTKRIESVQTRAHDFEKQHKLKLAQSLSKVPDKLATSDTFVSQGQSVQEKNFAAIKKGIKEVVNAAINSNVRAPVRGHIRLSDTQLQALAKFKDKNGDFVKIPDNVLEPILFGTNDTHRRKTMLLREDPLARYCRKKTGGEKCLDGDSENLERIGDSGDHVRAGAGVTLASEADIPRFVARLMDSLTAPEDPVSFGGIQTGKRADQDDIQNRIDALSFRHGPADVPAFYDFHNLQIAFEHVWQEAIDKGILDLAEDAYNEIVELGGKPTPKSVKDLLSYGLKFVTSVVNDPPPTEVIQIFHITRVQWNVLTAEQKHTLRELSKLFLIPSDNSDNVLNTTSPRIKLPVSAPGVGTAEKRRSAFITWRQWGERIIHYAQSELEARKEAEIQREISDLQNFNRLHTILSQLEQRLKTDYPFTVYAADRYERSINFGILITYRQKWEPVTYQAGELAKTITLAPKEVRKFSKKVVVKRTRARKEVTDRTTNLKEEYSNTSRVEAEIVRNAQAKTNFNLTAEGTYNIGISEGSQTTAFGADASKTSNEVKKEFREAVFKSAQEYKDDHRIELSTEETFEEEFMESGEIMNPNDELPVTFLFYELQRRFKVSEHIHRILPVILVAQEVPAPHEIDEDWLISYDWILRRFLLDDSFRPALDYLSTQVVGDEYALKEMRKNVEQQRKLTEELKEEVVAYRELTGQRYAALESAIERSANAARDQSKGGLFGPIGDLIPANRLVEKGLDFLTGDGEQSPEAAQIRERAARDAYEKAAQDERDFLARLNREITALNSMTEAYTKALGNHLNHITQISRLRVHILQNILYYMQAIWLMEPPDQRFLRLHKVEVPVFNKKSKFYTIQGIPTFNTFIDPSRPKVTTHEYIVQTEIEPKFDTTSLVEVADLDNLLGFKGNYMIFPLKKSNPLTEFMLAPYLEQEWELYDPDVNGNMTLDEFSDYVCCLKEELSSTDFEAAKPELKALLEQLLTSPLRDNEEIVVPTDSLFIEALPGVHPILEDFKLIHRAIDVKSAQEDERRKGLENLRLAYRLLDKQLEDPDIDAKYVFEGDGSATIVPPSKPPDNLK